MEDRKIKTAVFGGAFDPPHNAHLEIAKAAKKENGYDRIIFLPSYNPPHKKLCGSSVDRLNMLKAATEGMDGFLITTYELDRDKIGYTAEILPRLKEIYGEFDFIIGGDSMADMHKWYCPERILRENNIVVAVRNGEFSRVKAAIAGFGDSAQRVRIMRYTPQYLSSTDIRLMVRLGEDISGLVPRPVYEYIKKNSLYDDCAGIRVRLKNDLTEARYIHTLSVVHAAVKLNKQYGLDSDKVFFSALLHDSAKSDKVDAAYYPIPRDSVGTPVAHAFAGAYRAKEYGIDDGEIFNAIYYHTTGRKEMTPLEKLIFTADMIEDDRDFEGVDDLRSLCFADLDKGFRACIKATYEHLKKINADIYYLTKEAYHYYCGSDKGRER